MVCFRFQVWDQVLHGSVPDSCCHEETEDCGRNKIQTFTRNPGDTNLQIWKDGCLEILEVRKVYFNLLFCESSDNT